VSTRKSELAEEAWAALTRAQDAFRVSWMEAGRNLDLNPGELRALAVLSVEGAQPMGALAKVLHCDASNVTWLADRLEARGLVERHTAPNDRRVKTLSVTPAGRALHDDAHALLRMPPAPLLALSASELRTLRDLMTKCWEQSPSGEG
jgi:DNA-binding MarR family transcriptional regulator